MAEYNTVFIPSAGTGSRVSDINPEFNKAMMSIDHKPIISHIIEKFPSDSHFVIAVGYKADLLKQYISLAHSELNISFVDVPVFEGEKSGLGITMQCAKEYLQVPFIFISNDTLILDEIPTFEKLKGNWIGYADSTGSIDYRNVKLNDNSDVTDLCEKGESPGSPAYIGICGISDFNSFWQFMEDKQSSKIGESFAIKKMIASRHYFAAVKFNWVDTGNTQQYLHAKDILHNSNVNILDKDGEAIWFVRDKVIKYSRDTNFIKNRIERSISLNGYVPEVLGNTNNMYCYRFIEGNTFSNINSIKNFQFLLDFLISFWGEIKEDKKSNINELFYIEKTKLRINEYYSKYNNFDSSNEIINGKEYKSINFYLSQINLSYPSIAKFHGDLHFENIIVPSFHNEIYPFVFIDWRQDFNGNLNTGDIYYDLAKLWHGLIISHELIKDNFYNIDRLGNEIYLSFFRKSQYIEYEKIFIDWLNFNNFDIDKVKILTALIFLNIAALHHYPYCHFLYYLGKTMLGDMIDA